MTTHRTKNLATKGLAILRARDAGKAAYAKADELLAAVLTEVRAGDVIVLANGESLEVIDNFRKGNKAWKPCGISRFDLVLRRTRDLTDQL